MESRSLKYRKRALYFGPCCAQTPCQKMGNPAPKIQRLTPVIRAFKWGPGPVKRPRWRRNAQGTALRLFIHKTALDTEKKEIQLHGVYVLCLTVLLVLHSSTVITPRLSDSQNQFPQRYIWISSQTMLNNR